MHKAFICYNIRSMDPKSVLTSVEARSKWIQENLRRLVLQESPSEDKASVDAAATLVEDMARPLGGRVKRHRQKSFGDVLELRFGPARSRRKPLIPFDRKSVV